MEWISVKSALPELNRHVLVHDRIRNTAYWAILNIDSSGKAFWMGLPPFDYINLATEEVITYWMPLPSPPEDRRLDIEHPPTKWCC